MSRILPTVLLLSALAAPAAGAQEPTPHADAADDAATAATAWLGLVDGGAYERAWREAAPAVRAVESGDRWMSRLVALAFEAGRPLSRALAGIEEPEPGAVSVPGEALFVTYRTEFERVGTAIERVLVQAEGQNGWKVFYYEIIPEATR